MTISVKQQKAKVGAVPKGDPQTGNFFLRLPPEMLEELRKMADQETRSVTGQIIQLLKEAMAARLEEHAPEREKKRK